MPIIALVLLQFPNVPISTDSRCNEWIESQVALVPLQISHVTTSPDFECNN